MSRTRQDPCALPRPVAVFAFDFAQGATTGRHSHAYGQLVHSVRGVMRVNIDRTAWILPPQRAVWVPTDVEHEVEMLTSVEMRTVYIVPEALPHAPRAGCVVDASPLLRELILAALSLPRRYPLGGSEERLFQVLLDAISFRDALPLSLSMPKSSPAAAIARALQKDPSDSRTLAQWAAATGGSSRTLARAFLRETRLSFGAWRTQLRLLRAIELLALEHSVTDVALSLGYDSTSAFITAFRRHLGTTPSRYFDLEPERAIPVQRVERKTV